MGIKSHTNRPAEIPGGCPEIERQATVGWTQAEKVRVYLLPCGANADKTKALWLTMDPQEAEELRGRLDDVLRCGP